MGLIKVYTLVTGSSSGEMEKVICGWNCKLIHRKAVQNMFFGKREKDKDVRISESQYKSLVGGIL